MDILLVEDDSIVRQMLTEVLTDEGYQVQCAANGRDALTMLRAADSLPFVILLDIRMPVMNGWDFLEAQRQDASLAQLPVIIISAGYNLERTVGARQSVSLVQKPIDLDVLLEAVGTYCLPRGLDHNHNAAPS